MVIESLQSGLLELARVGQDDVVYFHPPKSLRPLGRMNVPPKPSPQHYQVCAGLEIDSTGESWKTVLQPGQTYELRLSKNGGKAWAYYIDAMNFGSPFDIVPRAHRFPVSRDTSSTIRFTVHSDPAPPNLFAKLAMPKKCHLSGTPSFKLTIEFATDSEQPITIDKSQTPLSCFEPDFHGLYQLIECEDIETGAKVDWPNTFVCFDEDPRPAFPDDEDFVEIGPGQVWRFEYTIETEGPSSMGGLEKLMTGHTYEAQVATKYLTGFPRWMFGRREDLLKGDIEEKKRRWKIDHTKTGRLRLAVRDEPVEFVVVD